MAEPSFGKMSSMHFYAWKKGLKTGMYYLRTRPAADPIKFSIDKTKLKTKGSNKENYDSETSLNGNEKEIEDLRLACSLQNKEACMMCSS